MCMATNLALDNSLINEAKQLGRHKTKRETVTVALKEYVTRLKQVEIFNLFGTIDIDPQYDYKKARTKGR